MFREIKKKGFTIIELLTVMSIIIILISVLVPALNTVRRFAKVVTQHGQFSEISKGLELFRNDHRDTYPDSSTIDANSTLYCGAMKLCEALLGQDGMGYHPSSNFNAYQPTTYLFNEFQCVEAPPTLYIGALAPRLDLAASLRERVKYVGSENIRATPLQYMYGWTITTGVSFYNPGVSFKNTMYDYPNSVIGDVFLRADVKGGSDSSTPPGCDRKSGQKVGMPVLYYKADPARLGHDTLTIPNAANPNTNIYNFDDNYAITALGCPWEPAGGRITEHPMSLTPVPPQQPGQLLFYREITNPKATTTPKPHNEDTYILMSAGWDGLYGTSDDVFNFAD